MKMWQRRVPLEGVACNSLDGRTKGGMRKALKRMLEAETKTGVENPECKRLKSYDKLVRIAEKLIPGQVDNLEEVEFEAAYTAVVKEFSSIR